MTFDVFNLYLENGASYGMHVNAFSVPYDPKINLIYFLALLGIFSNVDPSMTYWLLYGLLTPSSLMQPPQRGHGTFWVPDSVRNPCVSPLSCGTNFTFFQGSGSPTIITLLHRTTAITLANELSIVIPPLYMIKGYFMFNSVSMRNEASPCLMTISSFSRCSQHCTHFRGRYSFTWCSSCYCCCCLWVSRLGSDLVACVKTGGNHPRAYLTIWI